MIEINKTTIFFILLILNGLQKYKQKGSVLNLVGIQICHRFTDYGVACLCCEFFISISVNLWLFIFYPFKSTEQINKKNPQQITAGL